MFYVYCYTLKEDGRKYVGKTNDVHRRHIQHRCRGAYFHNALRKYGDDAFDFKILWSGEDESECLEQEKKLIRELNSQVYGFNLDDGGVASGRKPGYKHSEETKAKIARANTGKTHMRGVPKSEEHKKAIGEAHRGRKKNYRNGRSKIRQVETPSGEIIEVDGLQTFEKSVGIPVGSLRNTLRTGKPHYSGYRLVGE
jgi:group I intron endonuclease